jgi:choline dehydrogenase-like flavoprotein
MTDIRVLPENDKTNGWNRILSPRLPQPPLVGEQRADWAVVGAGYAGLAAARRLAENRPNDRIVLLEAHEVGENASARNSGFAIDLPHNVGSSLAELEARHRFMRLSRAAIDYLDRAVRKRPASIASGAGAASITPPSRSRGAGACSSRSRVSWMPSANPIAGSTPPRSARRSARLTTTPRSTHPAACL